MGKSAQSVYYFGIYVLIVGLTLLLVPNTLLQIFSLEITTEVWIRVVGMLVLMLGVYYLTAAKYNYLPFFQMTVYMRVSVLLFFAAFVLLGLVKWTLLLFALVDLLGAAWTHLALKKELNT